MRSTTILFATVAATCIAGCSSKDTTDPGGGNNTACTVTLSGAITATSACTVSATYARIVLGRSDFSILNSGSPGFTLGVTIDGKFASGTITQSSNGVEQAITTASNNDLIWSQTISDPARGTVTVVFSSVSLGSDGYTFTVHGTADGTMAPEPNSSATGTVTFHVTF